MITKFEAGNKVDFQYLKKNQMKFDLKQWEIVGKKKLLFILQNGWRA